jgi:hypothetical protein
VAAVSWRALSSRDGFYTWERQANLLLTLAVYWRRGLELFALLKFFLMMIATVLKESRIFV